MREIKALYLANAREFMREPMATFLVLLLPVVLAAFFGLIFSGSGGVTLELGVVNEDAGPAGEQFLANLESSLADEEEEVLDLHTGTRAEMVQALKKGDLSVVILLPQDLTDSLASEEPAAVEVFYDPARSISGGVGLGMVRALLSEANATISGSPPPLVMVEKSVQTSPLRPIDLHVPNLLGIALFWLGLFGTAMPLVQQREGQVLRRLSVTPLTTGALLVAQVAWRVTVGLLQAALFLLVGYLGFGVTVTGDWTNWLLLLAAVTMGALVFISLAYFLAGLAASTEGVMAIVQIVNFPMMFLSGSLFEVEILPDFLRPVVAAMPLTYLSDALRQIISGAPPLHPLWLDFGVLGGWLVVLFVLAARFWRWE
jgi:ABC-2 type transport system permease protein